MPNLIATVATSITIPLISNSIVTSANPQWFVYKSGGFVNLSPAVGQPGQTSGSNNGWTFGANGAPNPGPPPPTMTFNVTAPTGAISANNGGQQYRLYLEFYNDSLGSREYIYYGDSYTVIAASSGSIKPNMDGGIKPNLTGGIIG